jgi:hypothetical protein
VRQDVWQSGADQAEYGRHLPLGFFVVHPALESDKELLIEHGEDSLQTGNRRDVVARPQASR